MKTLDPEALDRAVAELEHRVVEWSRTRRKRTPWPSWLLDELLRLNSCGASQAMLGRRLGFTRSAMSAYLKQHAARRRDVAVPSIARVGSIVDQAQRPDPIPDRQTLVSKNPTHLSGSIESPSGHKLHLGSVSAQDLVEIFRGVCQR